MPNQDFKHPQHVSVIILCFYTK